MIILGDDIIKTLLTWPHKSSRSCHVTNFLPVTWIRDDQQQLKHQWRLAFNGVSHVIHVWISKTLYRIIIQSSNDSSFVSGHNVLSLLRKCWRRDYLFTKFKQMKFKILTYRNSYSNYTCKCFITLRNECNYTIWTIKSFWYTHSKWVLSIQSFPC